MVQQIGLEKTDYKKGYKELQAEWKQHGKELLLVCRLAYWTYWISKFAEVEKKAEIRKQLFTLKNNAMILLAKSDYVQIRKFVPMFYKKLCLRHAKSMRISKENPHYWLYKNNEILKKCKDCRKGAPHYYSLYSLAVLSHKEDIEDRKLYFNIYCPYPIMKDHFPEMGSLERVKKYKGVETITVDIDNRQRNVDLTAFPLEDIVMKYYFKNYEALDKYLKN